MQRESMKNVHYLYISMALIMALRSDIIKINTHTIFKNK